jgi:hypothetical protein
MMKHTTRNSLSKQETNEPKRPHPWLLKHYQEKRQRTIMLVKASVNHLVDEGQTVTLEALCRTSLALDPEGRGVKKSAILENPEAHAYYRQHSTSYMSAQNRKRQATRREKPAKQSAQPLRIDPNRDVERVRYRYLQMTKPEIVERLLTVEQAYADLHQQLAHLQFQHFEQVQQ